MAKNDSKRFLACDDLNFSSDDASNVFNGLQLALNTHGLNRLLSDPTNQTLTSRNLLDVVFGNAGSRRLMQVTVQPSHSASDHNLVTSSFFLCSHAPRQLLLLDYEAVKLS
jgi:hypothetical protein